MFIKTINQFTELTGRLVAWLVLFMTLIIVYDVTTRYLFSIGSVGLQELQWHLFSLIFLFGAAYTFKYDEHVRVDIIYKGRWMNDESRAWVNIIGGLLFLVPFCLLIINASWQFVYNAFIFQEASPDAGGLAYRFLLKAAIPIGFSLLLLQGIANIITNIMYLVESQGE